MSNGLRPDFEFRFTTPLSRVLLYRPAHDPLRIWLQPTWPMGKVVPVGTNQTGPWEVSGSTIVIDEFRCSDVTLSGTLKRPFAETNTGPLPETTHCSAGSISNGASLELDEACLHLCEPLHRDFCITSERPVETGLPNATEEFNAFLDANRISAIQLQVHSDVCSSMYIFYTN